MVTIYDVAERAGVSAATVSRVFNGIAVSPQRAQAVHRAAQELGFVRNRNARRLRMSSPEIVAMMVPDIENPFFSAMTRAVDDVVRTRGYSLMLCNTDEDPGREQAYLHTAVAEPVAGVIMVPANDQTDVSLAAEHGLPVVCADRRLAGVDCVVADNVDASAAAVALLFEAGHRRVACITGPEHVDTADQRLEGWAAAVHHATGRDADPRLVRRGSFSVDNGERSTRELLALADPPDAIFAANNRIATGVLRVLSDQALLPPAVGVVSFGGLPLVLLAPIGVLVTHLPAHDIGTAAARLLLERIDGSQEPARDVVLPVTIGDEVSGVE